MDGDLFFVLGIILVIAAVALAFVGIRGSASFPGGRGLMVGLIGLFVLLVGATMAFAIVKSEDEQEHREQELAQHAAEATTTAPSRGTATAPAGGGATTTAPQGGGATSTLDFSTPPGTALAYNQKNASTRAGSVTIDFQNNQAIEHDVAIQRGDSGPILGQTDLVSNGSASTTVNLTPGSYTFFCTVPGHREAGMVGPLTVK